MKIFKFKKSIEVISNLPFWGMFVVLLGIIMIILTKVGNVSVAEASEIPKGLEEELILAARFYNSENCFAYKDAMDLVHTNVIDYSKFTQSSLDKCYPQSNVHYAFHLSLEPPFVLVGPPIFQEAEIKTFNWIEGKFAKAEIAQDVNVLFENNNYNGKLRIRIQDVG